ncbi:hypothetical protein [Streptomyces xanthophaeus]|uniref:hypothetical protein n=1 Tax=Streptomyces xanthophaeus TaxID=67385 RepID=UPI0037114A9A
MRGFRGHDGRDDSRHDSRHNGHNGRHGRYGSRRGWGAAGATEGWLSRRRTAGPLLVWWLLVTVLLWVPGKALAQPVTAWECAVSAVLLMAVGEAGEGVWQRLRRRVRRAA